MQRCLLPGTTHVDSVSRQSPKQYAGDVDRACTRSDVERRPSGCVTAHYISTKIEKSLRGAAMVLACSKVERGLAVAAVPKRQLGANLIHQPLHNPLVTLNCEPVQRGHARVIHDIDRATKRRMLLVADQQCLDGRAVAVTHNVPQLGEPIAAHLVLHVHGPLKTQLNSGNTQTVNLHVKPMCRSERWVPVYRHWSRCRHRYSIPCTSVFSPKFSENSLHHRPSSP